VRRLVVIVAVLALNGLTACTSAAEKAAAKFAPEKPKYESNIGKDYWVSDVVQGYMSAECKRRGDPRIGMNARPVEATC
jgi:hypothetical protein